LDEDELEDELAELQQEELDNKMLDTGPLPVDKLPAAPNAQGEFVITFYNALQSLDLPASA
jgi:charged multivesicular body protein 4A/B